MDFHLDSSEEKYGKNNDTSVKQAPAVAQAIPDEGYVLNDKNNEQYKSSPVKSFFRKRKEFLIALLCVTVCGVLIFLFFSGSAAQKRAKRIFYDLDGPIYMDEIDGKTVYFSFKDGKMSEEIHGFYGDDDSDNFVTGDIDNYNKEFKIVVSLLSKKVAVHIRDEGGKKWQEYRSNKSYIVDGLDTVKYEDVVAERNDILCAHSYVSEVITVGTCQTEGEIKKTCVHCGKVKTVSQKGTHEYKDYSCVTCGRINLTDFKGETALKYSQYPGVYYTNCVIQSITEYPTCVTIDYKPVCVVCDSLIEAPDKDTFFTILPGYIENAKFRCSKCGFATYVAILYD